MCRFMTCFFFFSFIDRLLLNKLHDLMGRLCSTLALKVGKNNVTLLKKK